MFVSPFWSYRIVKDTILFTNWVTKRSAIHSPQMIEYLEGIFALEPAIDSAKFAWASDFEILFESQSDADKYFLELGDRSSVDFPLIDQIELTNRCPYTCEMCPRTDHMNRALGDMPMTSLNELSQRSRDIRNMSGFSTSRTFGLSTVARSNSLCGERVG